MKQVAVGILSASLAGALSGGAQTPSSAEAAIAVRTDNSDPQARSRAGGGGNRRRSASSMAVKSDAIPPSAWSEALHLEPYGRWLHD